MTATKAFANVSKVMSVRSIFFIFLLIILFSVSSSASIPPSPPSPPSSTFSGLGSGTVADPYQITNISQLQEMSDGLSAHYILMNDIDAGETTGWNSGAGFNPVGDFSTRFTGTFDGKNHTINDLFINQGSSNVGFFGAIDTASEIRNVGLINVNVTATGNAGGLIGYNYNGSVTNCYTTGNVNIGSGECAGGLVGYNYGSLTNCYSTANVSSHYKAGGFVGYNNGGSQTSCFATGDVNSRYSVGGFAGYNGGGSQTNCYSRGNVSGREGVGGFLGSNHGGSLSSCYSTGYVNGLVDNYGGFVGSHDSGSYSVCYWDTQTSGQPSSLGGSGRTTDDMTYPHSYSTTYSGWDFAESWSSGGVWFIDATNDGYPYLLFSAFDGGSGTQSDPYQIATVVQLQHMNANLSAHYILTDDINASETAGWNSGKGFNPVGEEMDQFTGTFDGDNHTISGLYINRSGNQIGVFGSAGTGSSISNVGVVNVNITGNFIVGGLIGEFRSTSVTNCYSTGNVSAGGRVGGLMGSGSSSSDISRCYSSCNVSGSNSGDATGGFVGYIYGSTIDQSYSTGTVNGGIAGGFAGDLYQSIIKQSYARGNVSGLSMTGGFVGKNRESSEITMCYSTGNVSGSSPGGLIGNNSASINKSYWDVSTSSATQGINSNSGSASIFGNTTEEMKMQSTFVGWDFENVWGFDSSINDGYPYLLNAEYGILELFAGGSGSESDPYQISNVQELQNMGLNLSAHYVLINDIDASETTGWNGGAGFVPVGNESNDFAGSFDGINYTISGLFINRPDEYYAGLFGQTNTSSELRNVVLTGVNVTGYSNIGSLAGLVSGSVINCSSTGSVIDSNVSGFDRGNVVGGLIGYVDGGSVTNCYSECDQDGTMFVGGLIGIASNASIANCYSTGNVDGGDKVGGFVGYAMLSTSITKCYSAGIVNASSNAGGFVGSLQSSTVTDSYWNMNTSNQSSSFGGTGLTDTQMKDPSSYANWDLGNTWAMNRRVNDNYPFLRALTPIPPNTAPAVSILTPANNSFISGQFFVNASVVDDHYDPYLSNVTIANSSGRVAGYDDLSWNNLSILFDSRLLIDGFYNITWDVRENESAERYNGSNFSVVGVDNNDPLVDFNDETTDAGNYSLNWILGNITVFDGMLNRSTIYLYSNDSLINSSTSNNTTHFVNFTSLDDALYQLNASVWDLAGNNNSTQTRDILLDTQKPVVGFSGDTTDAGNVNHSWIFANVTIFDMFGYSNVSILLYNSTSLVSQNGSESHNFTGLDDGVYHLNSTVEDFAGNTNESETLNFLLDTAIPLIEFNDETTDAGNYSLDWILGNITVSDMNLNASGIYLYNSTALVNSSISNFTTHDVNFTDLDDSWYYLNASVWDLGGNINTTQTRAILIDNVAANIDFNSDTTPATNLDQNWIFANMTATDRFGYYNLTIDLYNSSSLINFSTVNGTGNYLYNFTDLPEGVYHLNATVVDLAWNVNTSVTRNVTLDTTDPVVVFNDETTDEGNFSQNWILGNVTSSDLYLNVSTIQLFNSSGPVNSSTSNMSTHEMNFTDLADGYYTLNATALDLSGNSNETENRTILLDTQAPVVDLSSDTTGDGNISQNWIFGNVTVTDAFGYSNVNFTLYNSTALVSSHSGNDNWNFTDLTDGIYYLNCTVEDLAGNSNVSETLMYIVDTAYPLIDFNDETTDTGNYSLDWILGNITVSDMNLNASGIYLYNSTALVNSSISNLTTHDMNFTDLDDSWYYLNASVWDLAGNSNVTETRTILVDTQEADIVFNSDTTAASNLSQSHIFANVTATDVFGYDNLTIWLYNNSGLINSSSAEGTGSHEFNFTGLADGVYYLNSTILDLAGNENETATRTIILDTTTPLIDFNDETTDTGNFSQNWILGNITVSDTYLNRSGIYLYNSSGLVNSSVSANTLHVMNFTGLADGYYDLNASVRDLAGNSNVTETRTVLLDTQEADIVFNSDTTAASNLSQSHIFANVSATDVFGYDNLTIKLYNNSGLIKSSSAEGTGSHEFNFTGLADGVYYLNSTIIDLAGNENETATRTIILDTTTPLIDFNDETTDTGNFSQNWILGNITVSDTYLNQSGIYLYNSSGPVNSSVSANTLHVMNFTGLADGYYDLNASVWDLAGNINVTETRTVLLDTQEADIVFNSDTTPASNLSQSHIFANVTATDVFGYDNLTIRLYNNSGLINSSSAEGTGSHNFNFTDLADGVYYLNSTIVDLAGNENETVTRTIILDTTLPLIDFNLISTPAGNFSQTWILGNITVSDTYLNQSGIYLYNSSGLVNSSISASTTHSLNVTGLADGYYQLNASVRDLAGNSNVTETRTILLDTQEADIVFNSDTTAASNLSQSHIFANVTATDVFGYDNLTIRLYNNSGPVNSSSAEGTGSHNFNFTDLADGVYYLNSTIVDLAGNENETATRTIILDTTLPLIDFNSDSTPAGNFSQSWILGNITVSDTYLNQSGIYLYNSSGLVNSSISASTTHSLNVTGLADGYYQLNASVWDIAGNINVTETRTILLDTQLPQLSLDPTLPVAGNYSKDWIFVNVSFNDTFGIANITYELYNSSGLCNSTSGNPPVNFTNLSSGVYYVNITVEDLTGATTTITTPIYGIDAIDMEITNVVAQTQDTSARIIWNTNEVTNSTVYYGRDMNVTYNVSKADFEINHSIRLTGLKDDTLYYYKVVCYDPFGFNNSTQVLNFTTERTIVDDGRPYYYPEEPEEEPEDQGEDTGSVPPRTVIVNAGDGEQGDTLDVDLTEDDSDGEFMVTEINIELGMDVGEMDVTCSQSPDSSQDYPMDISLAVGSGANIYGYVNLDTSSPGSVDGATIQFRIPAAWYEDNGLDPSSTAITHFADGSPQIDVLEVTDSSSDGEYYYFTVTTPGFSEFSVVAFPVEEEVEEEVVEILDEVLKDESMPEPEDEGSSVYMWLIPVVAVILGLVVFVIWKRQDK